MSYRQFCGLARSLDLVGDRWTLLIVRELLIGRTRYGEIQRGLPGIATNLLADRLRRLEVDGLVTRDGTTYTLTPRGRGLRPVIHELIRWSEPFMLEGQGDDKFDGAWLGIALEALLRPNTPGRLDIHSGGAVLHVESDGVVVTVRSGAGARTDAAVEADGEVVLGIATGHLRLDDAIQRQIAIVDGDLHVATTILEAPIGA